MNSFTLDQNSIFNELPAMGFNTVLNKSRRTLDERELRCVQWVITSRRSGKYKLSQLFAERWDHVRSKRSFGRRVKAAVRAGAFLGIDLLAKKSSGSCVYEVHQQAANDAECRIAA